MKGRLSMYNYNLCSSRDILCVDQKSFFASVSCILKGLDPLTTKLAVVGNTKRKGSVVLAATPELKKLGIKTGSRLYEIPSRNDIYIINPSMQAYIEYSTRISEIALQYVAPEDYHQYSIDEQFLDVTDSLHLFSDTPKAFALRLKKEIYDVTKIHCAIGIGENLLLSKLALDIEAKKLPDGIAEWRYQDVEEKLWHIKPLSKFWGINIKSEIKLNHRGIFNIGDLANYPWQYLKRDFGIVGVDWHLHANGIDESMIRDKHTTHRPSITKSQVLLRDYTFNELYVILLEHIDEVTYRIREAGQLARTISFAVGTKDRMIYRKQFTIKEGTNHSRTIIKLIWNHLKIVADIHALYRTVNISLTNFLPDSVMQLSLFDTDKNLKEEKLYKTIDQIKKRFGGGSILRATSLTDASTLKRRSNLISGHKR